MRLQLEHIHFDNQTINFKKSNKSNLHVISIKLALPGFAVPAHVRALMAGTAEAFTERFSIRQSLGRAVLAITNFRVPVLLDFFRLSRINNFTILYGSSRGWLNMTRNLPGSLLGFFWIFIPTALIAGSIAPNTILRKGE